MCGLYGWWLSKTAARAMGPGNRKLMAYLLASEMVERGDDSHGYYLPLQDRLYRKVGSALDSICDFSQHRALMGHTRSATKGSVTVANAHPFDLDSIIGAHNGIIHNSDKLDKLHGEQPVDSLHILRSLALPTAAEIAKASLECEGYAALTWYARKHKVWKRDGVYCCRATMGSSLECVRLDMLGKHVGSVWASTKHAVSLALSTTWDRIPGCSHVTIELAVGHVTVARENGWWTVPEAPEVRTGETNYMYDWSKYRSTSSIGSWVQLPGGGSVWKRYSDQMDEAEAMYNATGNDEYLHQWMRVQAQMERANDMAKAERDDEMLNGWPT